MSMEDRVNEKLMQVIFPGLNKDIVSLGMIKEIKINNSKVEIILDIRSKDKKISEGIKNAVNQVLLSIPEISSVSVNLVENTNNINEKITPTEEEKYLSDVKCKIAIASGKGGVGKSTVSVNLAVSLAKLGLQVGLLDSDIYGPSIPTMLGVSETPQFFKRKIIPIKKFGVKLMSLGFLMKDDSPVIWRGPLVMRALQQLMDDVDWGYLDVMLFDMPPGTGDAQLTLSQSVILDGAVIVTTPQDVALLDAIKGVQMFQTVNVPILGIIENMSHFICKHCNQKTDIFSSGGAKRECKKLNVDLLGEIPLEVDLRVASDEGIPVIENKPDHPLSKGFLGIAQNIMKKTGLI